MTEPRCLTRSDRADSQPTAAERDASESTHSDASNAERTDPTTMLLQRSQDRPVSAAVATPPSGCRVLLVEDEGFTGFMIETMLRARGCGEVWLVGAVDEALAQLQRQRPDVAVLDVNLGRQLVFPVAEQLERQQVPLLFATAYPRAWMPPRWRRAPLPQKAPPPMSRSNLAAI